MINFDKKILKKPAKINIFKYRFFEYKGTNVNYITRRIVITPYFFWNFLSYFFQI